MKLYSSNDWVVSLPHVVLVVVLEWKGQRVIQSRCKNDGEPFYKWLVQVLWLK